MTPSNKLNQIRTHIQGGIMIPCYRPLVGVGISITRLVMGLVCFEEDPGVPFNK